MRERRKRGGEGGDDASNSLPEAANLPLEEVGLENPRVEATKDRKLEMKI